MTSKWPPRVPFQERAVRLWLALRMGRDRNCKRCNGRMSYRPGLLARSIRGRDIAGPAFPHQRVRNCVDLEKSDRFVGMSEAARLRALLSGDQRANCARMFPDSWSTLNVLRRVADSPGPVAPGAACYSDFSI